MKQFLTLIFPLLIFAANSNAQSGLRVDSVIIKNRDKQINNALAKVIVVGGTAPYTYLWGNQNTPMDASTSTELTEGISHSVTIRDAAGQEVSREFYIPTISIAESFNGTFTPIVGAVGSVLLGDPFAALGLYDPVLYDEEGNVLYHPNGTRQTTSIPFIVVWLIFGALFFTIRMGFINVRGFRQALRLVTGKYDDPEAPGEVTHFQALSTAVSGTVGLGNIAGVAVAVSVGGAGATFWMIIAGLLGMSSKFVECTLGVKYRRYNEDGTVSGGPMHYLKNGLKLRNMGGLGKVLAFTFAILAVGASFGGGNMFQANQAFEQFSGEFSSFQGNGFYFGLVLAILVGAVIVGGIKSIAKVTERVVPLMAGIYVTAALIIIIVNIDHTGMAFNHIVNGAFNADALHGGFIGVLIQGFRRAAFSNEAGVGSAAIAHSAAKTKYPVSEGFVSLLEPFLDTVVICTLTSLVLIFTGFDTNTSLIGSQLTSAAFGTVISWFPLVLVFSIFLFALSTMISWSYYGLKAWTFLFGEKKSMEYAYKIIFLIFVVIGSSVSLGAVLDFSDMMILCMAVPNILGLLLLSGEVRKDMKDYLRDLKAGLIYVKPKKK